MLSVRSKVAAPLAAVARHGVASVIGSPPIGPYG